MDKARPVPVRTDGTNPEVRELRQAVERLQTQPDALAVTLRDLLFPAGGTLLVEHGLGRTPRGWRLVRPRGAAPSVYEVSATAQLLTLASAAACTADLEVWP